MNIELVIKIAVIGSMFLAVFGNGFWKLIGMIVQMIILIGFAIALVAFKMGVIYFVATILLLAYWGNESKKYLNQKK